SPPGVRAPPRIGGVGDRVGSRHDADRLPAATGRPAVRGLPGPLPRTATAPARRRPRVLHLQTPSALGESLVAGAAHHATRPQFSPRAQRSLRPTTSRAAIGSATLVTPTSGALSERMRTRRPGPSASLGPSA